MVNYSRWKCLHLFSINKSNFKYRVQCHSPTSWYIMIIHAISHGFLLTWTLCLLIISDCFVLSLNGAQLLECLKWTAPMTQMRLSWASGRHVPTTMPTGWSSCCWLSSFLSPMSCCSTCLLPCSGQKLGIQNTQVHMFVNLIQCVELVASLYIVKSATWTSINDFFVLIPHWQLHIPGSAR